MSREAFEALAKEHWYADREYLLLGWSARDAEVAALTAERDALRVAGALLSNCAFNLAQREHLTEAERRSLDESRRAWDATCAMIAAAPKGEA